MLATILTVSWIRKQKEMKEMRKELLTWILEISSITNAFTTFGGAARVGAWCSLQC